ncbi:TnsA-like heteromeric transposase endonuclease subunit [Streptomyces rishiriensis]|uniref:TnsA-like heteromeric transposase endonuclease subunit n=1 Tax=Streptomyces rishiriensis TaxID=68264 RepID=UPI00131EE40D|nr:TnsA-like heteromeric transposase endonuclease subunit [Streptomyces rishiriensis]
MTEVVWAQFLSPAGRLLEKPVHQVRQERLEERAEVWRPHRYRGRQAIATWWRPAAQARHAGCVSLGALEAAVGLEFDPQVVSFTGWPVRLAWAGSTQGFVPDFFARLADGRARLVVCRPPERATSGWEETSRLLEAAGEQAGWEVRVHPGGDDTAAASNRRRLSRYRHARLADTDTARVLHQVFARPRPFADGVKASALPELATVARALHLVWMRELLIDWSTPFVPARSLVWSLQGVR